MIENDEETIGDNTTNPEYYNIKQLKEVGMWDSYGFLPAWAMVPYIKRMKGDKIFGVEVGTLKGESAYVLLQECKNITLLNTIDPYMEHKDYDTIRKQYQMNIYKEVMIENLKEFNNTQHHYKKSVPASLGFDDESLDFVMLDGDHSYEEIKNDLTAWYPKLKKRGYMFIHDTHQQSVYTAIKDWKNEHKIRIPLSMSKNFTIFWVKQ